MSNGQIEPQVRVGLSLLVVRGDQVLLGRRKASHGAGEYGTPGGHMEHGESPEEGLYRELSEECGAQFKVSPPVFLCVTNIRNYLPKHYIDIAMVSHWVGGEPENMEPHKLERWEWHPLGSLPDNRFGAVDNMVIAHQTGQRYF